MAAPPQLPRVLISREQLEVRVQELAAEISLACHDLPELTLVVVLKGAFVFAADLARALDHRGPIEFIRLASYGDETTRGEVRVLADLEQRLTDRHLLVIDDIVDSGRTLSQLDTILHSHRPASIRHCVLLDKPSRRETPLTVEHIGFTIDNVWAVGYGMDHAGMWRGLPYVGAFWGS